MKIIAQKYCSSTVSSIHRFKLFYLILCVLVLLVKPAYAEEDQSFIFDDKESTRMLIAYFMEQGNLPSLDRLQEANKQYPVFIFIPGILGSKLELEDPPGSGRYKPIWGRIGLKDMFIDNTRLSYNSDQQGRIKPSSLHEFEFMHIHKDIYGDLFEIIANMNWTGIKHFFQFAYDWRQDNKLSAQDLDDKIKKIWLSDLDERPVVFITHSMGGLIFKWWYHHFFVNNEDDYNFNIESVLFLGTPHCGSPAVLKAFNEGYNIIVRSGSWMQKIEQETLTRALNNHGPTFPSIYQLMPIDEKIALYVDLNVPNFNEEPINLFVVDSWRRLKWPKREILGLSHEEFYQKILPTMLDEAQKFHITLRSKPPIDEALYLYSFRHKTPVRLKVTRLTSGKIEAIVEDEKKAGDGTVPTDVAKNWEIVHDIGRSRSLTKGHMDLPKDEQFLEMIRSLHREGKYRRSAILGQAINKDDELARVFAQNRIMLPIPVHKQESADTRRLTIASANVKIFAFAHRDFSDWNRLDKNLYLAARHEENRNTRQQLYATYLNTWIKPYSDEIIYDSPPGRMGWAANNLGHMLYEKKQWEDAKACFRIAINFSEEITDTNQKWNLLETASNNLKIIEKKIDLRDILY